MADTIKVLISEEQVKAWMDAETWFTAEEAVKYGFADAVSGASVSSGNITSMLRSLFEYHAEHYYK